MTVHATAAPVCRAVAAAWLTTAMLTAAACTSHPGTSGQAPSQTSTAGPPTPPPTSAVTAPLSVPTATPTSASAPAAATTEPASPRSPSSTAGTPHACLALQLAARWTGVPGSEGMGQVSSDLALQNTSSVACAIDGYPALILHSATGTALPTRIAFDPVPVAMLIVQPGGWVHSELRYSSNIAGDGEPISGPCEPKASYALVVISGSSGTVRASLDSPQPVCGKGRIEAKPYAAGSSSPVGG